MMDGRAAQDLHIEMPHVKFSSAGFPHERKGLDQQPVERLSTANPIAQAKTCLAQIVVVELFHLRRQVVHQRNVACAAGQMIPELGTDGATKSAGDSRHAFLTDEESNR